jgi:hypothetical protein
VACSLRPIISGIVTVTERQADGAHLERIAAYSYRYRVASRWRRGRLWGAIGFAAAAPLLAIAWPTSSALLAAGAAFWLVLGRTALMQLERHSYRLAVTLHELYDTKLFSLDWNDSVAGPQPSRSTVLDNARRIADTKRFRTWFEVDDQGLAHPLDVMLCQFQSATWSQLNHRAWGSTLISVSVVWTVALVAFGTLSDMTLVAFLVALFLPSAPALLDATELGIAHVSQAGEQTHHEKAIEAAFLKAARKVEEPNGLVKNSRAARRIQDQSYRLRRSHERVPTWFHKLSTNRSSTVSIGAAAALRQSAGI